nr:hypothetical protein [Tanacetum cinerariifolium]
EPASPVKDVSEGEACPTESGFIADQDRATIAKTSTLPHNSAPRVTSPAADEGSMQYTISKLTTLCTSLQRKYFELLAKFQAQKEEIVRLKKRVQVLEDTKGVLAKQSGDDVLIKGRSINEGEASTERISNDSEEIARVLTSMDAATILAGEIDVPTGSGFIPTAGPPATVISTGSKVSPTASPIVTLYSRRNGKEVMVESDTPKKQRLQKQIDAQVARELEEKQEKEDRRMNKQIARDAEVARIHAEEEIQGMIDSLDMLNETQPKSTEKANDQESQEGILYGCDQKQLGVEVEDFIPMGSKEEYERLKRKGLLKQLDREDLNQLWTLVKEYRSIRPATNDKEMELWVELKRIYEPDPEDQLWTLTQNFM